MLTSQTRVIGLEDGVGNSETNDLTTTNRYNVAGDLLEAIDVYGKISRTELNKYGAPERQTDPFGNVTSNSYNSQTGTLTYTADNFGNTTSFTYNTAGNVTGTKDRNGNTQFTATYTPFGEIASVTPGVGNPSEFRYNDNGNAVARWTIADGFQLLSITEYDFEGRTTKSVSAKIPESQSIESGFETVVIPLQFILSQSSTVYNDIGQAILSTDTYGLQTETTYDINGRVIQTRSQSRKAIAGGGTQTVWNVTRTVYDAASRAIAQTEPYVEGTVDPIRASRTVYDDAGRLKETYQVSGIVINFNGPAAHWKPLSGRRETRLPTRPAQHSTIPLGVQS